MLYVTSCECIRRVSHRTLGICEVWSCGHVLVLMSVSNLLEGTQNTLLPLYAGGLSTYTCDNGETTALSTACAYAVELTADAYCDQYKVSKTKSYVGFSNGSGN